ncbi:hypothetical protein OH76DRAFT_1114323 [Lentinus brumalis]|uniref:Heterokaryon incompatibility domain-containing protein n=1 Tax=Lentinus brumalis TaxID=2498619 RepID=A0A371CV14_9APHY|nr:hypothetical protein OH76DRAFT_1114323 [Polyporus brumalis]
MPSPATPNEESPFWFNIWDKIPLVPRNDVYSLQDRHRGPLDITPRVSWKMLAVSKFGEWSVVHWQCYVVRRDARGVPVLEARIPETPENLALMMKKFAEAHPFIAVSYPAKKSSSAVALTRMTLAAIHQAMQVLSLENQIQILYVWMEHSFCLDKTNETLHRDNGLVDLIFRNAFATLVLPGGLTNLVSLEEETQYIDRHRVLVEVLLSRDCRSRVFVLHKWPLGAGQWKQFLPEGAARAWTVDPREAKVIQEVSRKVDEVHRTYTKMFVAITPLEPLLLLTLHHGRVFGTFRKDPKDPKDPNPSKSESDTTPVVQRLRVGLFGPVDHLPMLGVQSPLYPALTPHRVPHPVLYPLTQAIIFQEGSRGRYQAIWRSVYTAATAATPIMNSLASLFGLCLPSDANEKQETFITFVEFLKFLQNSKHGKELGPFWLGISSCPTCWPELPILPAIPDPYRHQIGKVDTGEKEEKEENMEKERKQGNEIEEDRKEIAENEEDDEDAYDQGESGERADDEESEESKAGMKGLEGLRGLESLEGLDDKEDEEEEEDEQVEEDEANQSQIEGSDSDSPPPSHFPVPMTRWLYHDQDLETAFERSYNNFSPMVRLDLILFMAHGRPILPAGDSVPADACIPAQLDSISLSAPYRRWTLVKDPDVKSGDRIIPDLHWLVYVGEFTDDPMYGFERLGAKENQYLLAPGERPVLEKRHARAMILKDCGTELRNGTIVVRPTKFVSWALVETSKTFAWAELMKKIELPIIVRMESEIDRKLWERDRTKQNS